MTNKMLLVDHVILIISTKTQTQNLTSRITYLVLAVSSIVTATDCKSVACTQATNGSGGLISLISFEDGPTIKEKDLARWTTVLPPTCANSNS